MSKIQSTLIYMMIVAIVFVTSFLSQTTRHQTSLTNVANYHSEKALNLHL